MNVPFKIGDTVKIIGGNHLIRGSTGIIVGITGSKQPFHWHVKLYNGAIVLLRGDEITYKREDQDGN
jgi:hypothetical protein